MRRLTRAYALAIPRRNMLKAGLAFSVFGIAAPFPLRARGEQPVKMGMVEPRGAIVGSYTKLMSVLGQQRKRCDLIGMSALPSTHTLPERLVRRLGANRQQHTDFIPSFREDPVSVRHVHTDAASYSASICSI